MVDEINIAVGKYLEIAQIWSEIRFPFAATTTYKLMRSQVLRYSRFKGDRGKAEEAIELINRKRKELEEELDLNADKFFFGFK